MNKKLINLSETQLLSLALKENHKHKDYKMLEASADLGIKRFPKTKHYDGKLKRAYLTLADHYMSEEAYYEYTKTLRKALHVAPGNGTGINKQIIALNILLDNYGQEYIKKDFEYLEFVVQLFRLKYSKGQYSKKVRDETEKILSRIALYKSKATEGDESKHTFQIIQLIAPFTLGLTKEQIDGISDALVPYIPELIEELERIEKEKDKD